MKHTDISKVKVGDLWVWEKPCVVVGVANETIDVYDPQGTEDYANCDGVLDNHRIRAKKKFFQSGMRDYGYYFVSSERGVK